MVRRSIAALVLCLAGAVARAEPEGYRGGEGRPVGTSYLSGGISITVRGIAVDVVRRGSRWSCGGMDVKATGNLVTVSLVIANPSDEPVSTQLALTDLVVADSDGAIQVLEGSCVKAGRVDVTEVSLGAHRRTIVPVQFLAPRRTTARILVYNDDDFPALFALARPKRAKVR